MIFGTVRYMKRSGLERMDELRVVGVWGARSEMRFT